MKVYLLGAHQNNGFRFNPIFLEINKLNGFSTYQKIKAEIVVPVWLFNSLERVNIQVQPLDCKEVTFLFFPCAFIYRNRSLRFHNLNFREKYYFIPTLPSLFLFCSGTFVLSSIIRMKDQNELIELNVTGMHCNNCALSVHKLLEKKGLKDIYVDFANEEVKFSDSENATIPEIIKDIEGLGFKVYENEQAPQERFYERVENKFYFSLLFALPLFAHMFLPFHWLHDPLVQLGLCIPVFILGFLHFGKSAYHSLKNGMPNMDVLVFVGFTSAFIYSLIGTVYQLGPNYMFYETTAVIITLVFLGNVFEKRSVSQTTTAVRDLLKYQRVKAIRIINGEHETIDSRQIASGDILLVNSGDKIPADGDIIWGEGTVNESLITGESVPVEKVKYDSVIGGTILEQGTIKISATKVGKHSVLSQIIEIMKRAHASKPPIQPLGDRVAGIFVPVVISIAVLTFLLSYFAFNLPLGETLMRSIAVLVISCPCAMGLATPTAVMVGLGRAAKQGVLIKGGATVEEMANLKYMVFDKTGTLTTGEFAIR